jgi:hypothetical protein
VRCCRPAQELFRLIRQGRLEWRAEVAAADLARMRPGLPAVDATPGGDTVRGVVRMVAPTVDPPRATAWSTSTCPAPGALRAGMFARGEFDIGASAALTLPQGAVLLRDGFSYVMRLGPDAKVVQTKVETGRRVGDRVEITGGLAADARVVASGGGFLADGDTGAGGRRGAVRSGRIGRRGSLRGAAAMKFNVSSWSIRNPTPSILLFVLLTLAGLMGFRAMKVQNFPDIDLPMVTVTASLPGASPAQMETEVARKIENSLATLQGSSTSTPSCATARRRSRSSSGWRSPRRRRWTTCATRSRACAPTCRPTCATR